MPKTKNISVKLNNYIKEYGSVFSKTQSSSDDETLFCNICKKNINCSKKCNLKQHLNKVFHKESENKTTINTFFTQNDFNQELCEMLMSCNIPLFNANKQKFKNFIEKFTQFRCPDESLIRRFHIPKIYEKTIESIRDELDNEYIWLSIDETTDVMQRHVFSVIVGALNPNKSHEIF